MTWVILNGKGYSEKYIENYGGKSLSGKWFKTFALHEQKKKRIFK